MVRRFEDWLDMDEPGIYFILCDGWVKIGMSRVSLKKRVQGLLTTLPPTAVLLDVIKTDRPREMELRFHEELAYLRGRGEWFKAEPVWLATYIKTEEWIPTFNLSWEDRVKLCVTGDIMDAERQSKSLSIQSDYSEESEA